MSEAEAIPLAQAGDSDAFGFLFTVHRKFVYQRCYEILKHPEEAEDLTQEVFMHLLSRIKTFRGRADFRTWLYNLTTNKVLDYLRGKERRPRTEFLDGQELYELPDQVERIEWGEIMSRMAPADQKILEGRAAGHKLYELGQRHTISRKLKQSRERLQESFA